MISEVFKPCSFAKNQWEFGVHDENGCEIFGPVLVCETHYAPASWEVYECEPCREVGLCQPTARYVEDHTGFYGEDLIDRHITVDRSRCRCGRPVDRCSGREDADLIRAVLREQLEALGELGTAAPAHHEKDGYRS